MKPRAVAFQAVLNIFLFGACSHGALNVQNDAAPGDNETLVVGKVIIEPAPERDSGYDGGIALFFDKVLRMGGIDKESLWEMTQVLGNEGWTFFKPVPAKRMYCVMAVYFMGHNDTYDPIYMPVSFVLDVKLGDKAVYIGTIKFTRDYFYNVKKVEVIDEYSGVLPEFIKKYGSDIRLKKAIAIIKKI